MAAIRCTRCGQLAACSTEAKDDKPRYCQRCGWRLDGTGGEQKGSMPAWVNVPIVLALLAMVAGLFAGLSGAAYMGSNEPMAGPLGELYVLVGTGLVLLGMILLMQIRHEWPPRDRPPSCRPLKPGEQPHNPYYRANWPGPPETDPPPPPPPKRNMNQTLRDTLIRGDSLSDDDVALITANIEGLEVREYLRDLYLCDGTDHEARLAAILLGILQRLPPTPDPRP